MVQHVPGLVSHAGMENAYRLQTRATENFAGPQQMTDALHRYRVVDLKAHV